LARKSLSSPRGSWLTWEEAAWEASACWRRSWRRQTSSSLADSASPGWVSTPIPRGHISDSFTALQHPTPKLGCESTHGDLVIPFFPVSVLILVVTVFHPRLVEALILVIGIVVPVGLVIGVGDDVGVNHAPVLLHNLALAPRAGVRGSGENGGSGGAGHGVDVGVWRGRRGMKR
jgi:hypothetical protein